MISATISPATHIAENPDVGADLVSRSSLCASIVGPFSVAVKDLDLVNATEPKLVTRIGTISNSLEMPSSI